MVSNYQDYSQKSIIPNRQSSTSSFNVENTLSDKIQNERSAKKKKLKILDKIRKINDNMSKGIPNKLPTISNLPSSSTKTLSHKKALGILKMDLDLEEKIETDSKKISEKSSIFDNDLMRSSSLKLNEDIEN